MKTTIVIVTAAIITWAGCFAWKAGTAASDANRGRAAIARRAASAREDVQVAERRAEAAEKDRVHWRSTVEAAHAGNAAPALAAEPGLPAAEKILRNWQEQTRNPYVHFRWVAQQRLSLAGSESFLRELGLSAPQVEKFNQISIDGAEKLRDLRALTDGGLFPDHDPVIEKLKSQTQSETDAALRELLGDGRYARWQEYQRADVARDIVKGFAAAALMAAVPVAAPELRQLVQIHAAANSGYRSGEAVAPASIDWRRVDAQVRPLLSEAQWKVYATSNFPAGSTRTYSQVLVAVAKAAQTDAAAKTVEVAKPPGG